MNRSFAASRGAVPLPPSTIGTTLITPKTSLSIGMDLDGVNYNFAASLRRYLRTVGYAHPMPDPLIWDFFTTHGWGNLTPAQFVQHANDGVNAGIVFRSMDWFDHVNEAWDIIRSLGHTIDIATDRSFGEPGRSEQNTIDALAEKGLKYDTITFTADKASINPDMMLEDKAENFLALEAAGVDTWLVTRPWNQHVKTDKRVRDVLHFAEVVREVTRQMRAVS